MTLFRKTSNIPFPEMRPVPVTYMWRVVDAPKTRPNQPYDQDATEEANNVTQITATKTTAPRSSSVTHSSRGPRAGANE